MRKIREVVRLALDLKLGHRAIARSLSIGLGTVGLYLKRFRDAGLTYPLPEGIDDAELDRLLFPRSADGGSGGGDTRPRPEPDWNLVHAEMRKKGVTLLLLWEEYKAAHPDGYQLTQFYARYKTWKARLDVTLRQDHKAGEKLFVDFAGQTVPIVDRLTGEVFEAQIFVAVLGASNFSNAEATLDQSLESWIGAHVRAFAYFSGVTEILVSDNLRSGVSRACRYEPDINPTYEELARHYGAAVIPARAQKPRDKAKVEAGVLLVERWILAALRNRTFFSLSELNRAIRELLDRLNDRRFKKLPGTRRSAFEAIDAPALRPLPREPFVMGRWKDALVNIDYHVEIEKHYYSVPYALVHERVGVRFTEKTVEIFHRGVRVASHVRSSAIGKHTTLSEHMPKSHQRHLDWTPSRIVSWAEKIGPETARAARTILESRPHPEQGFRSCLGILRLSKEFGPARLEAACARAAQLRAYSYRSIQSMLKKGLDRAAVIPVIATPMIEHANIRGADYFDPDGEKEASREPSFAPVPRGEAIN